MYIYNADLWCDSCGAKIKSEIEESGEHVALPGDSDHFPQWAPEGEADYPVHCAAGAGCLEAIDLAQWGLAEDAPLYGAETRLIGALLEDLTEEGEAYTLEMLAGDDPTPYQRALHALWRDMFNLGARDMDDSDEWEAGDDLGPCQWYALCENEATRLVAHPALGDVPSCERCQRIGS